MNEPRDTLGRPVRDLRISVTDRCNFRCPYCMPAEVFGEAYEFLPRANILRFEEIDRIARLMVGLGVRKLRLTGGEPLLRSRLPDLIRQLAGIPGIDDLALTTNGFLLADRAQELREAGLQRVTVSLDSHDPEVFQKMSGRDLDPERVFAGIEAADRAGLGPVKINTVVQRGVNDHQLVELAERFRGTGSIVRFIEFMDVGTRNDWNLDAVVSAREIVDAIHEVHPLEPLEANYPGEVARRYRYADGEGEIGVIASVSQPFCGDCTRARLTADGQLVTCLFGTRGRDLLGPIREGRSDDALRAILAEVWRARTDRYSELRAADTEFPARVRSKIEMYQIGG